MPKSSSTPIPESFGHADVRFIGDPTFTEASLPGATNVPYNDFGDSLLASGQLPPLGNAPVSAWALARLAALCGRRLPYQYGQECGSDGDDFWLRFISFSVDGAVGPTGKVSIAGSRTSVCLFVHTAPPHTAYQVRDSFLAALLEAPTTLRPCCIVVVYTALDDDDHWKHIPFALGWDGVEFIFRDSPEHIISAEDYE